MIFYLKKSNVNYFALIVEEVEFPTRVDHYKKVWGKNKDVVNSAECVLSQEYAEETDGVTFFYGVVEIKENISKNIMGIINKIPYYIILWNNKVGKFRYTSYVSQGVYKRK